MTLKSLEERKRELIQQIEKSKESDKFSFEDGMRKGINDSFHSFSELISIYFKYKSNVKLLMAEQKNIWKKWIQFYEHQTGITKSDYLNSYNEWLFNFLFGDTIISENIMINIH